MEKRKKIFSINAARAGAVSKFLLGTKTVPKIRRPLKPP
jgi:hypothetical protein